MKKIIISSKIPEIDALSAKVENNMKKLDNIELFNQIIKQAPEKMKETFTEIANRNH